ncbi:hypothetical protein E0H73_39970 [Kribbella pittospori]|uniref:Cyanophycinase n=1 Tax=Kribbella pittospori TaxID=722689 RepID=A0A4R0K307_9ACTN|nr:Type 1 glutamine amidotransferase-like domain-containing protein [Kribbella pittospori]TCC52118.1 hypothetical protein E0H73_39970 [Kribbella pittospori]
MHDLRLGNSDEPQLIGTILSSVSIFLVGGGPDTTTSLGVFDAFRSELQAHASGRRPRVAVVVFDHEGSAQRYLPAYTEVLVGSAAVEIQSVLVRRGRTVEPDIFVDLDGIVVAGGPTPDYLAGLSSASAGIRAAVGSGVPYVGFSAGAMIAPDAALIGGLRMAGLQVCPSDWSEGLDQVTVRPGLGLLSFTVDVHSAQAGTLGRAVALVEAGEVATTVGIDEDTCLVLAGPASGLDGCSVAGSGSVWIVDYEQDRAVVSRIQATLPNPLPDPA